MGRVSDAANTSPVQGEVARRRRDGGVGGARQRIFDGALRGWQLQPLSQLTLTAPLAQGSYGRGADAAAQSGGPIAGRRKKNCHPERSRRVWPVAVWLRLPPALDKCAGLPQSAHPASLGGADRAAFLFGPTILRLACAREDMTGLFEYRRNRPGGRAAAAPTGCAPLLAARQKCDGLHVGAPGEHIDARGFI